MRLRLFPSIFIIMLCLKTSHRQLQQWEVVKLFTKEREREVLSNVKYNKKVILSIGSPEYSAEIDASVAKNNVANVREMFHYFCACR